MNQLTDYDTERSILNSLLSKPDLFVELRQLQSRDFDDPGNRAIFNTMFDMFKQGKVIDVRTLGAELQATGVQAKFDHVLLLPVIESIRASTPEGIRAYEDIVVGLSKRRQLIGIAGQIEEDARDVTSDVTLRETELANRIQEILLGPSEDKTLTQVMQDVLKEFTDNEQEDQYYKTGYPDLDEVTTGLKPGQLIVLAARPAMGKSALALNIASNGCEKGKAVFFLSLEMSKQELGKRLAISFTGISADDIKQAKAGKKEINWGTLIGCSELISKWPLELHETGDVDVDRLKAQIKKWKTQNGGRLDLVVIDYLQLMSAEGFKNNRVQEVSHITRSLKMMAKELKVPVIVLSQLSRGVEARQDKRPLLADLRESGSIEQDADLVLMLYRDNYYTHASNNGFDVADLCIAKNRHGPTKIVKLVYCQKLFRFESYAPERPFEK